MIEMNKRMFEVSMGDSSEEYIRKASIALAVIGFFSHISVWGLYSTGRISVTGEATELLASPLSALYTPFSILLVYEVYQLIRTIPESFSSSVGKSLRSPPFSLSETFSRGCPKLRVPRGGTLTRTSGYS